MSLSCLSLSKLWPNTWTYGPEGPPYTVGGALPAGDPFDLFCVCGSAVAHIPTFVGASLAPSDHGAPLPDGRYQVRSDDGTAAVLLFDVAVPSSSSLEAILTMEEVPADLSTQDRHVFLGIYDDAVFCGGLFFSQAGIAFSSSHADPPLLIPGSEGLIVPQTSYVLRLVMDEETRAMFVYLSPLDYALLHGPKLLYVLPPVDVALAAPLQEGVHLSVLGSAANPSEVRIQSICFASSALIDNFPPEALPGPDGRRLGIAPFRLDGSRSTDPEGAPLTYLWRVVALPELSRHRSEGADGRTLSSVSGFVDKLYTDHAAAGPDAFSYSAGDILLLEGTIATIVSAGSDGDGAFFLVDQEVLPEGLTAKGFLLLRQDGFTDREVEKPLYQPDAYGTYRFQLQVSDAALSSEWASQLIRVERKESATGIIPDTSSLWDYMSDTWSIVEGANRMETLWSSVVQVLGGETLRLWQAEASRSLKDIPRRIVRKWLNYDLLLREPLPELSRCTARFSGVASAAVSAQGLAHEGEELVLSIPGRADLLEITVPAGGTPRALAKALTTLLQAEEPLLTCTAQRRDSTDWELLLLAPFPFSVVAGTTFSIFSIGDGSSVLKGAFCQRVDAYTLKLDLSLQGRGLVAGDLLSVQDASGTPVTLRVRSVQDSPDDFVRSQRVRTFEQVPQAPAGPWEMLMRCQSPQLDFWKGGASAGDVVVLVVNGENYRLPLVGILEGDPSSLGVSLDSDLADLMGAQGASVRFWGLYRRSLLPIDPLVVSIPTMAVNPWEGEEYRILRQHVDYWPEETRGGHCLKINSALFTPGLNLDYAVPRLWAEETQLDNSEAVESKFGLAVDFPRSSLSTLTNLDYLTAVRALWFARAKGSRLRNLRIATQVLLGLPIAEERGVLTEYDPTYSSGKARVVLQDLADSTSVRSYTFPGDLSLETNPATKKPYAVGDTVEQYAPLVQGVSILDHVNAPGWDRTYVQQGALHGLEAVHSFLVQIEVSAFDVTTLQLVQNFLQRVRPSRVKPLFLVRIRDLLPDQIDVTEELSLLRILSLYDSPHSKPYSYPLSDDPLLEDRIAAAGMFDNPDPSPPHLLSDVNVGRYRSGFDRPIRPGEPAPTDPSDYRGLVWGWDMSALAPEYLCSVTQTYVHAGGTIPADLEAELDPAQPLLTGETLLFGREWCPPFNDLGVQLSGQNTLSAPVTVDTIGITVRGVPPALGRSLRVEVYQNGVAKISLLLVHSASGVTQWWRGPSPAPGSITPFVADPSDVIRVGLFADTGEEVTQRFRLASVVLGHGASWTSGGALSAGTYLLRGGLLDSRHALA